MSFRYILAFGSNLGNRQHNILEAQTQLTQHGYFLHLGRLHETLPLVDAAGIHLGQDLFLNQVGEFVCELEGEELYKAIRRIEDKLGHDRTRKWAARHLDIDILLQAKHYEGRPFASCPQLKLLEGSHYKDLQIPHPQLSKRDFLLQMLHQDLGVSI